MEEVTISGAAIAGSMDFSLFSLFIRADFVVKSVIIILILASIYSWMVIVSKIVNLKRLKKIFRLNNMKHITFL